MIARYELYADQGQGGIMIEVSEALEPLLEYEREHKGEASFAIRLPSGEWFDWRKA